VIQKIETAPKDGTHIILVFDGKFIEGWWYPEISNDGYVYGPGYWDVVSLSSHGCGCCSSENDEPTHWMPKPVDFDL
jgi:hypothetical protein